MELDTVYSFLVPFEGHTLLTLPLRHHAPEFDGVVEATGSDVRSLSRDLTIARVELDVRNPILVAFQLSFKLAVGDAPYFAYG
jgi:hypothetical protein